jgi:hypothetical protein
MKYKIATPNTDWNGLVLGVTFTNGIGETDSEEIRDLLVNVHGYRDVTEEKATSNKK